MQWNKIHNYFPIRDANRGSDTLWRIQREHTTHPQNRTMPLRHRFAIHSPPPPISHSAGIRYDYKQESRTELNLLWSSLTSQCFHTWTVICSCQSGGKPKEPPHLCTTGRLCLHPIKPSPSQQHQLNQVPHPQCCLPGGTPILDMLEVPYIRRTLQTLNQLSFCTVILCNLW